MKFHLTRTNQIALASLFATILLLPALHRAAAQNQQSKSTPTTIQNERSAMTQTTGFYCDLKALTPEERDHHHQLTLKLNAAKLETRELPDGYAFRLQSTAITLADLAAWIAAESKCCPFFDFEIELQRDNGPLWLKLRGSDGVKPFMQHEFHIS
jgi:hypothetical protein